MAGYAPVSMQGASKRYLTMGPLGTRSERGKRTIAFRQEGPDVKITKADQTYAGLSDKQQGLFKRLYADMSPHARETPARLDHSLFQKWYWAYPTTVKGCTLTVRQMVCVLLWDEFGGKPRPKRHQYDPSVSARKALLAPRRAR